MKVLRFTSLILIHSKRLKQFRLGSVPREIEFSSDCRYLAITSRNPEKAYVYELDTGVAVFETERFIMQPRDIHWMNEDRHVVFFGPESIDSKSRSCVHQVDTATWSEEILPVIGTQLEASDLSPAGDRLATMDYKNNKNDRFGFQGLVR